MELDRVLRRLDTSISFYDVMTVLFQTVTADRWRENQREYDKWVKERPLARDLAKIVRTMAVPPGSRFQAGLKSLKAFLEEHAEISVPLMIETVYIFDRELSCLPQPRQRTHRVERGPMNSSACQEADGACLYLTPPEIWQQSFLTAHKLRQRNLGSVAPSGLSNRLQNCRIIPKEQLGGLIPRICIHYPKTGFEEVLKSGQLRIAVFPFAGREWFTRLPAETGLTIDIHYNEEQNQKLFDAYCRALWAADQCEADIVIFPEMALGSGVREKLVELLRQQPKDERLRHVQLIFAGTEWLDGENTAYIFTAEGRLLLTQKKREYYDFYNKELKDYQRENLSGDERELWFLDVPGLGRVSYVICRDILDVHEQMDRGALLLSGMFMVSCYTQKLDEFRCRVEDLVKSRAAIVTLCNACAPVEADGGPVGFLSVPVCDSGKRLECRETIYTAAGANCKGGDCVFCSCMDLYTIGISPERSEEIAVQHKKVSI